MKNNYQTQTISNLNKSNNFGNQVTFQQSALGNTSISGGPAKLQEKGMKSKIEKLSDQIQELRKNLNSEDQLLENMDKLNQKNHTVLSSQINALRKAFNMLADVVMEEIETVKVDMFQELQDQNMVLEDRVKQLENRIVQTEQEQNDKLNYQQVEQIVEMKFRSYEKEQQQQTQYFEQLAVQLKDENNLFLEKLKVIISNNSNRIDILAKERQNMQQQINELKVNTVDFQEKVALQEDVKFQLTENNKKFIDFQKEFVAFKNDLQNELQSIVSKQSEIFSQKQMQNHLENDRIFQQLIERNKDIEIQIEKNAFENEKLQSEMQDGFKELAMIYKDSAKQIINDFERSIKEIHTDNKFCLKKLNQVEDFLNQTRDEVFQIINQQEVSVTKKFDILTRSFMKIK
ncbi:hypothetical protein TTHERM_00161160 (macronuclear) [Tetrahymena thermophila SB210]|uniref:Uncharacterized protein n=1 Tax=Tetrahymena thermophila (strain SB210) TaxID=312017 RepID=Q22W16_TETTS|nr:hypothetical protein TTHERM_00161160 [Tetrahymena thermophila SB210]EAR89601.1 hypothetical protein TTHERM_00161160 [Tetrahymena thermophila SB210]|eukprot:XP_001009846.1 hypothetical protein TTHERM_00161160 [Tetrahymena thermophila SB210]